MSELIDQRILGAISWRDAVTGLAIARPLRVFSSELNVVNQRDGLTLVLGADGLEEFAARFDLDNPLPPLNVPAPRAFTLHVQDPTNEYLCRTVTLTLPRAPRPIPRDSSPAVPLPANSVFTPETVTLFRSPEASVQSSWAVLSVSARRTRALTGEPFAGVLVRISRADNNLLLGRGITDKRGEAIVPIAGLPLFQAGPGAVSVTSETQVRVTFVAPPPPPADPPGASIDPRRPLPAHFYNWSTFENGAPATISLDDAAPGASSTLVALSPGRVQPLRVGVTPRP